MSAHRLLIAALIALPLMTTDAAAQVAERYRASDRNNDGVITRAEWRGALQTFRDLDWNRDGVLSGDEVRDPAWRPQGRGWRADTFEDLDRDNNGRLSRGEWTTDRLAFHQVDRNGDNFISRGEFLNANITYDPYDVADFNELDDDGSGRIERREWTGTAATFNRLDLNRDNALTRSELAANDVVRADEGAWTRDDFAAIDDNNNGVLSRLEWRNDFGQFNDYDRNRDGVITRREYAMGPGTDVDRLAVGVDGRTPWTSTGIYLNAGDIVTYDAQGTIQMSTDSQDRATPAGAISGRTARNAPRPDLKAGVLLFRIGGTLLGVAGNSGSFTAPHSGELQLGVNDDHFPDNSGDYVVNLSVRQR